MEYATRSLNHSAHNHYGFYVTLQSCIMVGKGLRVKLHEPVSVHAQNSKEYDCMEESTDM